MYSHFFLNRIPNPIIIRKIIYYWIDKLIHLFLYALENVYLWKYVYSIIYETSLFKNWRVVMSCVFLTLVTHLSNRWHFNFRQNIGTCKVWQKEQVRPIRLSRILSLEIIYYLESQENMYMAERKCWNRRINE